MTAISAVFHAYKPIPTRKAFQIILEVPEERTHEVFTALGYPNSSTDIWVGVARLEMQGEHEQKQAAYASERRESREGTGVKDITVTV